MIYVAWALLLISQAFSNTLVSRARNSSSLAYHSVASLFSNGVWFVSLFILVDRITVTIKTASIGRGIAIGVFYTTFTLLGSVGSHWFCMRFLEKGKRSPSHVSPQMTQGAQIVPAVSLGRPAPSGHASADSANPREGGVYSRKECPFEYCDSPTECWSIHWCHHVLRTPNSELRASSDA